MTKEQAIEKAKEQYSEIWDCDINHPKYEDTVEEIVTGVIRLIMQPTSDDCVSRTEVIKTIENCYIPNETPSSHTEHEEYGTLIPKMGLIDTISDLPPVTPTHCIAEVKFNKEDLREICNERIEIACEHGTCKDCKHWKDSDGVYRRGIGAESKCPINNSRVFEGTFYCADYEKRGGE